MISYAAFWATLKESQESTYTLIKNHHISSSTLDKLRKLREMIELSSKKPLIEIDGGVNATTAPLLAEAGADILVAGSYVFGAENPIETISQLKNL